MCQLKKCAHLETIFLLRIPSQKDSSGDLEKVIMLRNNWQDQVYLYKLKK